MADTDLAGILQMLQAGPTEAERKQASSNALMRMGLGILAQNTGGYGPPRPLAGMLGAGGLAGMDAYQNAINQQALERRARGTSALQALQIKRQMDQDAALANFDPTGGAPPTIQTAAGPLVPTEPRGPTPPGMSAGTSTAAFGVPDYMTKDIPPQVPQAPMGPSSTAVPDFGRLIKAGVPGPTVNALMENWKLRQPQTEHIDAGNEILVRDKRNQQVLQRIPKGAAPGAIPTEASDLTPSQYRDFLTNKATAGANRSITNVNAYTPASEEAQRDFIKSTRATYDTLKQAPVALESIEKAKALVPSARSFMGPGGETALDAAKFLNNRLGMSINTEGVKDAEELRTRIFFNIMDNLKKMDAQPSQQQQQIMQEALGRLGTDPNALPRVLDAFGDVIKGKVALHNREVSGAIQRGVKFPYDPIIELRAPRGESAPSAIKKYNPATGRIE